MARRSIEIGWRAGKRVAPFDWSGGHPALDLVNTLDERPFASPIENLATYADLVRFAELAGLIEVSRAATLRGRTGPACTRAARCARQLREHLHCVLSAAHKAKAIPQKDLGEIAAAIRAAHAARLLVTSAQSTLAGHKWVQRAGIDIEIPLHACALAIEHLLVQVDRARIRKCGAHDCDVYFVDTSKGRRRQWCSMQNCGNREKQRRWRSSAE